MKVTALILQTWFDIAVKYTGDVTNAYAIAFDNGRRSTTDDLEPGEEIIISDDLLILKQVVQVLENKFSTPATGITLDDFQEINTELGIGKMAIGSTFIVR